MNLRHLALSQIVQIYWSTVRTFLSSVSRHAHAHYHVTYSYKSAFLAFRTNRISPILTRFPSTDSELALTNSSDWLNLPFCRVSAYGTSYGGRRGVHDHNNHANGGAHYSSKESQWKALKMIMAERAADCLAKLGLDSQSPTAMTTPVSAAAGYVGNGQHYNSGDIVRIVNGGVGGGLQSPVSQTSSLSGGAPTQQPNGCISMAAGSNRVIAANPQSSGAFGASHHRR